MKILFSLFLSLTLFCGVSIAASPNNVIEYTSSDGQVIPPYESDVFGANIVSNTYQNGQGMITFDGNVTSIGDYAFYNCSGLTSITIPASVTSIGYAAFSGCSGLTSITIPESVTSIGGSAFKGCSGLTSITIPESVTSIGYFAFSGCSGLTSITIPASVTSIGYTAFSGCSGLTSIIVDSGNPNYDSRNGCNAIIETSTNTLLAGCQNTIIPESVTSIGNFAFDGCTGLTSITIPASVTSIGNAAFSGCSGLTSITIPASVTSIGNSAFSGCTGLTSITVDSNNPKYDSRNGCNAIIETSTNTLLTGCQNTIIPASVTSIGKGAFLNCSGLTSITIPESVTSIGYFAFSGCSGLTSITIPASVTSIEFRAFDGCTGLTSITLPESVTGIGGWAFRACTSVTDVYVEWESPLSVSNDVFSNVGLSTVTLHVPYGTKELYKTADVWKDFGTIIEDVITDVVTNRVIYYSSSDGQVITPYKSDVFGANIISNTYENGKGIITFDGNVTSIGDYAFDGCSGLTSTTIPESVTSIGSQAFYYCSGLTSITIPGSVTSIGSSAFSGCSGLTSIEVESGNQYYDSRDNCNAIIKTATNSLISGCTNTIIPASVTSIGSSAFSGCSGLTSITIPGSVTSIGSSAFSGCSGLTSITIPGSVTSIRRSTFSGCSGLTSITIPESVTSIESQAFDGCFSLTSITIPGSVTSIGRSAFSGCSNLRKIFNYSQLKLTKDYAYGVYNNCSVEGDFIISTENGKKSVCEYLGTSTSVTLPSVDGIANYAFWDCSGLTSITIPNRVTSIGVSAFNGCTSLNDVTCLSQVLPIDRYLFTNWETLHVLPGYKKVFQEHEVWGQFKEIIEDAVDPDAIDPETVDPSHIIYYASSDGQLIFPHRINAFGANIISNTYNNGQGVIICDGDVTSIGYDAFSGCSGLTSITIPESVTSIGSSAFYDCSGLTSITIPNSVTSIEIGYGTNAFSGCSNLASISIEDGNQVYDSRNNCNAIIEKSSNTLITGCKNTIIPNSVSSVRRYAFSGCSGLTSITIPSSVTIIEDNAFSDCTNLQRVDIEEGVISLRNAVFSGCSNLSQINIPNSVKDFGEYVFDGCTSLPVEGSIRYADTYIVETVDRTLPTYQIREGTRYIGAYAFWSCENLTDISIPNSVIYIGMFAFGGGKLPVIDNIRYADTYAIEAVDRSLSTYRLKEGTRFIGNNAFENCENLNSIDLPNSLIWIGAYGFSSCHNLKDVVLPKQLTNLRTSAFEGCSLTKIQLPSSLKYTGYRVFDGCPLTDVYIKREITQKLDGRSPFSNVSSSTLHVPIGTKDYYISAETWKDFGTIIDDVIPDQIICYTSSDGKIVDPNDEESFDSDIISNTYDNGQGIIEFDGALSTIGRDAFAECSTLESMIIPDGVTSIGRYAFDACEALASVSIPASVNTIGSNAFRDCDVLENVSNYALIPQTLNSNTFTHYGTLHVVDGYKEVYAAADVWKNFTIIDDLPDANAAYITDGTAYSNVEDTNPSKIVYTRTFSSADSWQALYVPFSIPVDVLTENGLEVVELNNIHMYDTDGDKQFDKTTLEFLYLTDGETEANYPYLIKSANAGEVKLALQDVELKAAAETQIECASTRKVFKIKGTYTGVSGADMYNNNYYAVGGGTLVRAASADNALKPQRWYMSIENKDGSPVYYFAPKMRIMINGMEIDEYEENETGIQEISAKHETEETIYTLDGRRLVGTNSLKSGIYVKNHQKMIVR